MTAAERLAWLTERRTGIGASDAPNLVGVGYRDALAVYRSKTEPPDALAAEPEDGALARGIALEPYVADRYAAFMDVQLLTPPAAIVRNPRAPFQLASPDRVRADTGRPVEIKTALFMGEEWGPTGSDEVPDGYRLQVQQQMGVLGADSCDLAALDITAWELRVYRIAFDRDLYAWLTDVEGRFWREHVEPRVPPTIEWEARHDPRKLGLIADRGTTVALDPAHAGLFAKLADLDAIRKEAEAEYQATREAVQALMGRAERADCGPWTIKKVVFGEKEVPAQPAKPAYTKAGYTYLGKPTLKKEKKR